MSNLLKRIDRAIERKSILDHPFYQEWSAGNLDLESLREYSRQYYHLVDAFPIFLRAVLENSNDPQVRTTLRENVQEEETPVPHSELWLRFADALDVDRDSATEAELFSETQEVIDTLRDASNGPDVAVATAALYAYESQNPEVAETKMDGLRRHYGVTDERSLRFFSVHKDLDVEHAQALREVIRRTARDEDRIVARVEETLHALWHMLDAYGVQQN